MHGLKGTFTYNQPAYVLIGASTPQALHIAVARSFEGPAWELSSVPHRQKNPWSTTGPRKCHNYIAGRGVYTLCLWPDVTICQTLVFWVVTNWLWCRLQSICTCFKVKYFTACKQKQLVVTTYVALFLGIQASNFWYCKRPKNWRWGRAGNVPSFDRIHMASLFRKQEG